MENEKKEEQQEQVVQQESIEKNNSSEKDRFEIELYEEITDDNTGDVKGLKKVQSEHPIIIEAANKAELDEHAQRFAFVHQRMKVVKAYPKKTNFEERKQIQTNLDTKQETNESVNQSKNNIKIQSGEVKTQKPQYYTLGGIEIKNDNGKIYQKQWMRLTDKEQQNFRLVNSNNNKLVSLTNKHIEMKKWVLVETTDSDETQIEDDINE